MSQRGKASARRVSRNTPLSSSDADASPISPLSRISEVEQKDIVPLEIRKGNGLDAPHSTDHEDKGFEPDTVPRECTDVCWTVPFVTALIVAVFLSVEAERKGDLRNLMSLPDLNGRLCGHGSNTGKPFLYFCMQEESEWVMEGDQKRLDVANPICRATCPSSWNTSSRCWLPLNQSYTWVQDYPTVPFIGTLCRPSRVYLKNVHSQFQHFLATGPPILVPSLVARAWKPLLGGAVVSLLLSYLYLAALSFCARCMVLSGVTVVIVASGGAAAYLLWCAERGGCGMVEGEANQDFIGGAVMVFIIVNFTIILCRMSSQIESAVTCIQWSCKCILETPSLFAAPPLQVLVRGSMLLWTVRSVTQILSGGLKQYKWVQAYNQDQDISWVHRLNSIELTAQDKAAVIFLIVFGIWLQGVVGCMGAFVYQYVSQLWYFSGGMHDTGSVPLLVIITAWLTVCRYHFGSIICSGFLTVVALPFHLTLGKLKGFVDHDGNPVGAILDGCCVCCISFYSRFFQGLDKSGLLDVSLHSSDFLQGCSHVSGVWEEELEEEFTTAFMLNSASGLFKSVGIGLIGMSGHITMLCIIEAIPDYSHPLSSNFIQDPELLSFSAAFAAVFVAWPFMAIFEIVSDSILYCRMVQQMRIDAHEEMLAKSTSTRIHLQMKQIDRACGFNSFVGEMAGCNCGRRDSGDKADETRMLP